MGTASICERMIPAILRHRTSTLAAVASRDPVRGRDFASKYGIAMSFDSYHDMISSGLVDAIYNPLPNALHGEWTVRSLQAGLHVLCEKPLTVDAQQARQIASAASAAGCVVCEAFMYRHHPVYDAILDQVYSGVIGNVISLDSHFSFLLDDPESVVASHTLGGGALLDVGCYCVSFSRLIAGCEPVRVGAFATGSPVDESIAGILQFPNGIAARFHASIKGAERHMAEIHGTTGTLLLESPWHPGDREAVYRVQRHGREDEIVRIPGEDPYYLQVKDFAAACTGRLKPSWGIEDAIANMRVLDALRQAAERGH